MTISDRTKKILYVVLFVAAFFAIVYLLYIIFFASDTSTDDTTGNENTNTVGLPNVNTANSNTNGATGNTNTGPIGSTPTIPGVDSVATGGPTQTTVLTPAVNAQDPAEGEGDSLRYYNPDDGKFYIVDGNGKTTQLSNAQFSNVSNITWSDANNQAILEFPDGANIYYDLTTGEQVTLPPEYEEFAFSPTGDEIAFKYLPAEAERRVLAVSSPDGSSARTIESLGENEDHVNVDWSPTGTVIATFAEFVNFNDQEVGFIGLKGENFKGTVVNGHGLRSEYSSDGQQMLYSVYSAESDYKPKLWVVDANGQDIGKNRIDLQLNTFADKCSFSDDSSTIYCGVPSDSKYGFGLEPDILTGVTDEIYRIDLKSGSRQRIAVPVDENGQPNYTVSNMFVSPDNKKLYFRDQKTGQLIKINLE